MPASKKALLDEDSDDDVPLAKKKGGKNGKVSDYDRFMSQGDDKKGAKSGEDSDEDVPLARKRRQRTRGNGSKSGDDSGSDKPLAEKKPRWQRKFENFKSDQDSSRDKETGLLVKRKKKSIENGRRMSSSGEESGKDAPESKRNGKEKCSKSRDASSDEEDDESADEELRKELAEEVKSQSQNKNLDVSTEEGDRPLTREGRKFEGRSIPVEQPLLISGGIMKPYQIEGMIWMAQLRKVGANGIVSRH